MMLRKVCFFLTLLPQVTGYSGGPPGYICDSMTPGHTPYSPQASAPPYKISLPTDKTTYSADEEIEVVLEGNNGNQFKGFMVQARGDPDMYETYGSISGPSATSNPCQASGENAALAHTSSALKSSVTFTWTAPSSSVGNITFVFTVVQEKKTFWVKGTSSALTFKAQGTATTTTSASQTTKKETSPVSDTPSTEMTSTMPPNQINRDPECEKTKSCFPDASTCSSNCDFLISWRTLGDEDVEFTMHRKTQFDNYWIGIGFSADPSMTNDSVVECISTNGAVSVEISFNPPNPSYSNRKIDENDQFGVNRIQGSYANGILSCTFTRKINASLANVPTGTDGESIFFDLNKEWYLLVAHGRAGAGNKNKHQEYPKTSVEKIHFLTVDTDMGTTTPATGETGVIKKDSRCGRILGCYHDCDGDGTCGFLLTWVENGDDIDFTLTCKRPGNNVYCAIGLSKDKKMGDDSVFECVSSGQVLSVFVSYNDGRNNYRLSQDKFGISVDDVTHEDGILKCTFTRKQTAALAEAHTSRKKRARDPSSSTFFDVKNNKYNLLYAYGSSVGGFINKHQTHPKISSQKADFQRFMDVGAATVVSTLVKVHGVLMMCAWLFFARLGIFIAGQYKKVWPEGMEWFNQKRWFILHRSIMVTAFLATAAGFIVIFVHVGGYSEIHDGGFQKSHPIIGIIIMCLVTLNPIMAAFRPHPGTPKRPYFNFAHTLVGVTAYVCAVVNIFSGFEQASANVPFRARIVVWVYLGVIGVLEIISYIYECKNRKASKGETYEMKPTAGYEGESSGQRVSTFKVGLLCLYVVAILALVIAVCVIVWLGEDDDEGHDH